MTHTRLALLAIPLILLDPWAEDLRHPPPEEAAVRVVVQQYVDALIDGDTGALDRAFSAGATLVEVGPDGSVCRVPLRSTARRGWREGRRVRQRITVLAVDGHAALVRAELRGRRVRHVDYLSLLKVGEEWTIVNRLSEAPPAA